MPAPSAAPPAVPFTTAHRPWATPAAPWLMAQTWHDLLFAHWPLPPALIQEGLPAGLELDTFDNQAWLGVVPFRMTDIHRRGNPSVPWISAFPELNVRTYVRQGGRPGVLFFSLDAGEHWTPRDAVKLMAALIPRADPPTGRIRHLPAV